MGEKPASEMHEAKVSSSIAETDSSFRIAYSK